MKRAFRLFPMLFAMLLLLGHQLVPHAHDLATDETSLSAPTTIDLGWLGKVFSLDQGADHLEHFRPVTASDAQPDVQITALPQPVLRLAFMLPQLASTTAPVQGVIPIPQVFIANALPMRGPPSC